MKRIGLFVNKDNIITGHEFPPQGKSLVIEIEDSDIDKIAFGYSNYKDGEISNPSVEEIREQKKTEYIKYLENTKYERYKSRVVELIRKKYSINEELALLRQKEDKTEEYAVYNNYAEECKITAKSEILNE